MPQQNQTLLDKLAALITAKHLLLRKAKEIDKQARELERQWRQTDGRKKRLY